jgi:hypothetical protein
MPTSTTTEHEQDGIEPEVPATDAELDDLDDDDIDDIDELADAVEEPVAVIPSPTPRRRALSAVLATVVFEALYLVGITIIAFVMSGAAAVGPTLGSVFTSPFAWAPAAVFLVCALVVALPLRGGRRASALTGLVVAVVVYLGATFLILLVAAGWSAMGVFVQELGVYPFFLAAIVAREVMVWTRSGYPRVRATKAEPPVSAPA